MIIKEDTVFFYYESLGRDEFGKMISVEAIKETADGKIIKFKRMEEKDDGFTFTGHIGLTKQDLYDFGKFIHGCRMITYDIERTVNILNEMDGFLPLNFDGGILDIIEILTFHFNIKNTKQMIFIGINLGIFGPFKRTKPSLVLKKIYKKL